MTGSKRELGSDLAKIDATTDEDIARHIIEDDSPEWTDAQLAEAEIYEGDKFIRRVGRPKGSGTKELIPWPRTSRRSRMSLLRSTI